ncbi:trypsin-like peptidase domain-containing protein [Mycolicibacterium obuense]|uniref:Serine protease n=1 Tax=Mycolicibacterium obuense TaxID=1807 RepID=A0A0M2JWL5_9MYCO|nr:trypsin-like peptidase domain-containing protein [Mycolicibacterium obuense]KKF01467.1 hypothetical protein WN67_13425 [Mycolicibacterium obuense]
MTDLPGTSIKLSAEIPVESFREVYMELMYSPDGPDATADSTMKLLAKASGFFYEVNEQQYLVSARHCFTGQHWESGKWLSNTYTVAPTHVAIGFRSAVPAEGLKQGQTVAIHQFLIRLIDEAWQPVWLEHPRYGASVDAAAIPFSIPEGHGDLIVESWTSVDAGTRSMATKLWVSQNVAVVGYPYGLRGSFDLPIWTAGSVSSEPAMLQPYRDRAYPFFLIDARTRSGQSGSPVVSVRQPMSPSAISDKQVQFSPAPQWRLVGVYGGRVPEDYGDREGSIFGAQYSKVENAIDDEADSANCVSTSVGSARRRSSSDLGFAWRIEEVTEICERGVPGGTGPKNVDPGDAPPRLLGQAPSTRGEAG